MLNNKKLDLSKLIKWSETTDNEFLNTLITTVFNNFVSEENNYTISGTIGVPLNGVTRIKQENLTRQINEVDCAISTQVGAEEKVITAEDVINQLTLLGVDLRRLTAELAEDAYNFSLPINVDKFLNFNDYFWVKDEQDIDSELLTWNRQLNPEYYVIERDITEPNWNDWQISNKWFHKNSTAFSSGVYDISECVQAKAPIIEYSKLLELNNRFTANGPVEPSLQMAENNFVQRKTQLNQAPLFNLYHLDGTHAGVVSSVFKYGESITGDVNAELGFRTSTDVNGDFIFSVNAYDSKNKLLYFKLNGELSSIWSKTQESETINFKKDADGALIDYPGGYTPTATDGAWKTPSRFFRNLERNLIRELSITDLIPHFSSIRNSQPATEPFDYTRGGCIRDYGKNLPLLLSSLNQTQLSIISVLEFAERQYQSALSGAESFLITEFGRLLNSTEIASEIDFDHDGNLLNFIFQKFEESRSSDQNLTNTFSDTISPIKAWPITLPMIGLARAVEPKLNHFDFQLGIDVILHHDGHISPMAIDDVKTNLLLANTFCKRSDGTQSAGIVSTDQPASPFSRQLWFNPSTKTLKHFNVRFDTDDEPLLATEGDYWFRRSAGSLYKKAAGGSWVVQTSQAIADAWQEINFAQIRNNFIFAIEKRLHSGVPDYFNDNELLFDVKEIAENEDLVSFELARFSQKYNYDTFAPDFNQADAFTWNYSLAQIPGIAQKARWFDVYDEYFSVMSTSFDLIPTIRPNLEPWKLLGLTSQSSPYTYNGEVKPFIEHFAKGETDTNRRLWKVEMWNHIKSERPGLKLCVYTADNPELSDTLLPPYISSQAPEAFKENALLVSDSLPLGISAPYEFGQNGPIELVWKKSLEYLYGLAMSAFRLKPLSFIDKSWGISYVKANANALRVERTIGRSPSHHDILMHGERQTNLNQLSQAELMSMVIGSFTGLENKITISCTTVDDIVFFEVYDELNRKLEVSKQLQQATYFGLNEEVSIPSLEINSLQIKSLGHVFENTEKIIIERTNSGLSYSHVLPTKKSYLGIGQLFVNAIRYNFGNEEFSLMTNLFKNWNVKLCHKFSSTIVPESLTAAISAGAVKPDFFRAKLIKREKTTLKRITALRVQLVDMGPIVDSTGSVTRTRNSIGNYIPSGEASTWIFRLEGYDPTYPVLNYFAANQLVDHQEFKARNGKNCSISWKKYDPLLSSKQTIEFPMLITGLQNLLNVIFGYVDYLKHEGWTTGIKNMTNIDRETGLTLSWQLEAEKLIDRIYTGMSAGEAFILNPFMDELNIETPIGILSSFDDSTLSDNILNQAISDVIGGKIPLSNVNILRVNDSAKIKSATPIYSARLYIDEYEHIVLFNNACTIGNKQVKIINTLNGIKQETFILKYNKQDVANKKPILGGYILNGDSFTKNIMSDIDKIGNFYDSNLTFGDAKTRKHSLALLGFNRKEYFDNLSLDEKTQFNFWKGMIQGKGTNISLDAFLNHRDSANSAVDEIWAYKIASFGDSREKTFPEVKINSFDCAQLFTRLQFFNQDIPNYRTVPLYTQIASDDDTRWVSIDDLGANLKFEVVPISETLELNDQGDYPKYIKLKNIFINEDQAMMKIFGPNTPRVINSQTIRVNSPGKYTVQGYTWLTPSKISPIKLFDYVTNTLVEEIGLWHPAIGINAYRSLEIIDIISNENPAFYTNSLTIAINPNLRKLKPWGKNEVGTVWWNTNKLEYIPYYDAKIFPSRQVRETLWGATADWSNIEILEWIGSSVHPRDYDELAKLQEGNAEIPDSLKAAGRVAFKKIYSRDRIIQMRPIAWSQVGNAVGDAHPSFGSAVFSKIHVVGDSLVAESNSLENLNILAGMHFSGWKNDAPVGEVTIGDSIYHLMGSSGSLTEPVFETTGHVSAQVDILENSLFRISPGKIHISKKIDRFNDTVIGPEGNPEIIVSEKFFLRATNDNGQHEDVEVQDWYSFDNSTDKTLTLNFDSIGVKLMIIRNDNAPQKILASELVNSITGGAHDIVIREGVIFDEIISLPDSIFVNDVNDPEYFTSEYEWRCWAVPSQDDLTDDSYYEPRKWKPYPGEFEDVQIRPQVLQMMKDDAPLILNGGTMLSRYKTSWTSWVELSDEVQEKISNGSSLITFNFSGSLSGERIAVYVNGQQLTRDFVVSGNSIALTKVVDEGSTVKVIHKMYEPSTEELSFVPEITDNVMMLKNYRLDYEYTEEIRRDDNGNAIGKMYYFWVKDKTILHRNKSISLAQAQKMIADGDSQYAILTNPVNIDGSYFFDSCAIKGLNYLVTNDNTYKLRFTRDFTLRDDPEEMSLKNTHTQWQLIRRGQVEKIPSALWKLLTDSICEQDEFGNTLPNSSRTSYDLKNNSKTRFGFGPGQVLAESTLLKASVLNSIINTSLTVKLRNKFVPFFISSLDFSKANEWFAGSESSRRTMDFIWKMASVKQINDIFFNALEDAYETGSEFGDVMKTSLIHVTIQRDI